MKERIISRGLDAPVKLAHSQVEKATDGTEEASKYVEDRSA